MKIFARWFWILAVLAPFSGLAQETPVYEMAPNNYSTTHPHDRVTQMESALAGGQIKLSGSDREVMETLLRFFHIPETSQLLVFSKTSFQKDIIGPEHPRALYFNDDCYIGWVPGGLVEIAAIDPKLGPVFYSFDPRGLSPKNTPEFTREPECMRCHGGTFVPGVPGVFARSLYPDKEGEPIFREGSEVVDDQTPFGERWGGWYVTGQSGTNLHRGNVCASEVSDKLVFDPERGVNITNLSGFFDTNEYLAGTSDIVALMVFEHQTGVQNALTHANINCRRMLSYQHDLEHDLHIDPAATNGDLHFDNVRSVFQHSADEVADAMLFKNEAPLPKKIVGSPGFQKGFTADARRAKDGSSLKDLLVSGHLFKNRCSYLIYSDAFRELPTPLKTLIYARLSKALDPAAPDSRYCYIDASERWRIAKILDETLLEFHQFRAAGPSPHRG